MSEYTLVILIDQAHVAKFNNNGYKLCLASGIGSGSDVNYNVVAWSDTCAATVTVTWRENYAIAASKDSFSNGKKFTAATTPVPITFGESFTCTPDMLNQTPVHNDKAPKAGFLYINKAKASSAVLYKEILGQMSPVYLSNGGPLDPGTESLTPKMSISCWFQVHGETGNMISDFTTDPMVVDFTGTTKQSITYDGAWAPVNPSN